MASNSSYRISPSDPILVGQLRHTSSNGDGFVHCQQIYSNQDILIGRDQSRCQWTIDDPYLSAKHVRIYTIVYNSDDDNIIDPLVYAEDLSRNGTFWNDALIGKGNGGFLLSNGDKLRLTSRTVLQFLSVHGDLTRNRFDLDQEEEMECFKNQYTLTDRVLGIGAFARVHMAIEMSTRRQTACKIVDFRRFQPPTVYTLEDGEPARAGEIDTQAQLETIKTWAFQQKKNNIMENKMRLYYREVEILSSISHPNIIALHNVVITDNTMYIFQDLITAGDLFSYIESKNGSLLESEAAVITRQILIALEFLHSQCIVHRDLKPENIMITSTAAGARVVLTDFGTARRLAKISQRMVSAVGTDDYMAPELVPLLDRRQKRQSSYTTAVDMWSVGVITVVLLTGISPFTDPQTGVYSRQLASTCNIEFLRHSKEWKMVRQRPRDFVEKLLVLDGSCRMTAAQGLAHSWFSNEHHKIDFEQLYMRTVKNWYQRSNKRNIVAFERCSRKLLMDRFSKLSGRIHYHHSKPQKPVDPPYKPFPRRMHTLLWPKRSSFDLTRYTIEVKDAIKEHWPNSSHQAESVFEHILSKKRLKCQQFDASKRDTSSRVAQDTLKQKKSAEFSENLPASIPVARSARAQSLDITRDLGSTDYSKPQYAFAKVAKISSRFRVRTSLNDVRDAFVSGTELSALMPLSGTAQSHLKLASNQTPSRKRPRSSSVFEIFDANKIDPRAIKPFEIGIRMRPHENKISISSAKPVGRPSPPPRHHHHGATVGIEDIEDSH